MHTEDALIKEAQRAERLAAVVTSEDDRRRLLDFATELREAAARIAERPAGP